MIICIKAKRTEDGQPCFPIEDNAETIQIYSEQAIDYAGLSLFLTGKGGGFGPFDLVIVDGMKIYSQKGKGK
jgi:hypothetical protein